jgi:hypothetical protein
MPKTSPEKLAAALRANLKRRKQPPAAPSALRPGEPAGPAAKPAKKPPENRG